MNRRTLLGVILVLIGGLFLLDNMGLLGWRFWDYFGTLWPLLLIGFGIALLLKKPAAGIIAVLVVVVAAAGLGYFYGDNLRTGTFDRTFAVPEGAEQADITLDMAAGELRVDGRTSELLEGTFRYSGKYSVDFPNHLQDGTAVLKVEDNRKSVQLFGNRVQEKWDIELNDTLPLSLKVKLGAGLGRLELSDLIITNLAMELGAGDLDIRLGLSNVKGTVDIDLGAGSVTIKIPEEAGVRITVDDHLMTDTELDKDFGFVKQHENTYVSGNYEESATKYDIVIDQGVGDITVKAY